MPRGRKAAEEPRPEQLNSTARAALIRQVIMDLDNIDGQIGELQERRNKLKQTIIKGDLGMKLIDFAILRRFNKLEDEDRDGLFDTLREGFRALGIGEQMNFLDAVEARSEPATEEVAA